MVSDPKYYADLAEKLTRPVSPLTTLSEGWREGDPGFPLTVSVEEKNGISRTGWPISFALSLPAGVLDGSRETLMVTCGASVLPSQVEVLTRWPDQSAQHLRATVAVDLEAFASVKLSVEGTRERRADGVRTSCSDSTWRVEVGADTQFELDAKGPRQIVSASRFGQEIIAPNGEVACWAGVIRNAATSSERTPKKGAPPKLSIVQSGEVYTVIRREVELWQEQNAARMVTWLTFHAGQPWVRIYTWTECDEYASQPLVERETAFHGEFQYEGELYHQQESRFGPASQVEVIDAATCGPVSAQVVLPWLRELGITAASNLICHGSDRRMTVEWRPIDSEPGDALPMNSPCWVARYWREAALVLAKDGTESQLGQAVRQELEFRGPRAVVQGMDRVDLALQEMLTIPRSAATEVDGLALGQSSVRLDADYPVDGIDGQEWHNWESAYFFGFGWRNIFTDQKKAFGPRAMKCDGLRLLQYGAAQGEHEYERQVRLQARAWPVNFAPEHLRDGFAFCDIGYFDRPKSRGNYPSAVSHLTPYATNFAYAGRLLFHLFEMYCRTGEPMLLESFERFYRKSMTLFKEGKFAFNGDRIWMMVRDLARLYQFTEDKRYLEDLRWLVGVLPPRMKLEDWNKNYQCRLWNNESYALAYRLLGDEKMRLFHEGQMESYLADAKANASDETLLLPMVNTLPTELRWGLLGAQLMTGYAAWRHWSKEPTISKWYDHYWSVVREKLLVSGSGWKGLHYRLYTPETLRSFTWFDRSSFQDTLSGRSLGWDTDYADANHAPGELFRALTMRASSDVPYHYNLTDDEIVFLVDPAICREGVQWPHGYFAWAEGTPESRRIDGKVSSGKCTLLLSGTFVISNAHGEELPSHSLGYGGGEEIKTWTAFSLPKGESFSVSIRPVSAVSFA